MSAQVAGRSRREKLPWVIGAVVGVVAGLLIGWGTQEWQEDREAADVEARAEAFHREDVVPPPGDAVRSLLEQDSRVVVDPLLADAVPREDRERAETVLADASVPARVAYLTYPEIDAGYTPTGAAVQWATGVGETGHYVVLYDNGYTETTAVGLEDPFVDTRTEGQPGPALVRIATEAAGWEADPLPTEPPEPADFDYWSGIGGGLLAAILFGPCTVLPAFLLLRWYVGSRRRKVA